MAIYLELAGKYKWPPIDVVLLCLYQDLRPGDVSSKRNLWEKQSVDKVTSPTKVIHWED